MTPRSQLSGILAVVSCASGASAALWVSVSHGRRLALQKPLHLVKKPVDQQRAEMIALGSDTST